MKESASEADAPPGEAVTGTYHWQIVNWLALGVGEGTGRLRNVSTVISRLTSSTFKQIGLMFRPPPLIAKRV